MSVLSGISEEQWHLVGGNPSPGEPRGIADWGQSFLRTAEVADEARARLHDVRASSTRWEGAAAEAFRNSLSEASALSSDLLKIAQSYNLASRALVGHADELERIQARVRQIVLEALDADAMAKRERATADQQREVATQAIAGRNDVDSYLRQLDSLSYTEAYSTDPAFRQEVDQRREYGYQEYNRFDDRAETAGREASEADNRCSTAKDRLAQARQQIASARDTCQTLVSSTCNSLQVASSVGIHDPKPGVFDWLLEHADDLVGRVVSIVGKVAEFLEKWGPGIALALTVLAVIVPPLGAPLAAAAHLITVAVKVIDVVHLASYAILAAQGRKAKSEFLTELNAFGLSVGAGFLGGKLVGAANTLLVKRWLANKGAVSATTSVFGHAVGFAKGVGSWLTTGMVAGKGLSRFEAIGEAGLDAVGAATDVAHKVEAVVTDFELQGVAHLGEEWKAMVGALPPSPIRDRYRGCVVPLVPAFPAPPVTIPDDFDLPSGQPPTNIPSRSRAPWPWLRLIPAPMPVPVVPPTFPHSPFVLTDSESIEAQVA